MHLKGALFPPFSHTIKVKFTFDHPIDCMNATPCYEFALDMNTNSKNALYLEALHAKKQ